MVFANYLNGAIKTDACLYYLYLIIIYVSKKGLIENKKLIKKSENI